MEPTASPAPVRPAPIMDVAPPPVKQPEQGSVAKPVTAQPTATQQAGNTLVQPTAAEKAAVKAHSKTEHRPKSSANIVIITALVVFLLLSGLAFYAYTKSNA